jgi:hypothetical protein
LRNTWSTCFETRRRHSFLATCQLVGYTQVSRITQLPSHPCVFAGKSLPIAANANGWLAGWPGSCAMHVDKKSSGPTLELAEHTDLGNRKEAKRTRFSPTIIAAVMRSPKNLDPGLPCSSLALRTLVFVLSTQTLGGQYSSSTLYDVMYRR